MPNELSYGLTFSYTRSMVCGKPTFTVITLISVLLLNACAVQKTPEAYRRYIAGNDDEKHELTFLLGTLPDLVEDYESRFLLIQRIIQIMNSNEEDSLLILFLTDYTENNPNDPFNGYYLSIVAWNYYNRKAYPMAVHYFERILKNYYDLEVEGNSIHFIALTNLAILTDNPERRIDYYKELLSRFYTRVDPGTVYYYLGETYSELGEWTYALQSYKNFLNYRDTRIPEDPKAHERIKKLLAYTTATKFNWVYEDLDELLAQIRNGIAKKDALLLRRLMSKIDFFAVSWLVNELTPATQNLEGFLDNLDAFMRNVGRIGTALEVDPGSNDREAFLKTTGWNAYIKTWFFYFRKIDFPADPEIHNHWEWAGIYFGEKHL